MLGVACFTKRNFTILCTQSKRSLTKKNLMKVGLAGDLKKKNGEKGTRHGTLPRTTFGHFAGYVGKLILPDFTPGKPHSQGANRSAPNQSALTCGVWGCTHRVPLGRHALRAPCPKHPRTHRHRSSRTPLHASSPRSAVSVF